MTCTHLFRSSFLNVKYAIINWNTFDFQELSKNFITLDNLEMEIEKTLNTKVNYNFSIDLKGNKYLEMPDGSTVHDKEFSKDKQEKQSQASNS